MLSVLIADDEQKIGRLIQNLIRWDELGLECVGLTCDGQSAYEMILADRPDIVITDIRMPHLSGLDMIQKVSEQGISVHFIVISGYRYFDYAQTALKYGVKDYLLKPIDEDELNKILQKICDEEKSSHLMQEKVEHLEQDLASNRHSLHRELMDRTFASGDTLSAVQMHTDLPEDSSQGAFCAAGLKVDRQINQPRNEAQEQLITEKLTEFVDDLFSGKVIDSVVMKKDPMYLMILLNFSSEKREEVFTGLDELFERAKKYIGNFEHYSVTMGYPQKTGSLSEVNQLLEMAQEALRCRIYEGAGKCIHEYSENRNHTVKGSDIVKKRETEIEKYIQILKEDELEKIIRGCFDEAVEENLMASEYYEMAGALLSCYCKVAEEKFSANMNEILTSWLEESENCSSVLQLKNHVLTSVRTHMRQLSTEKSEAERKPVLDAIAYIQNNYGQKILLEDVAESCGFNANYFCEIFRKETGKNFSAYLLEVRMEEAKRMLRDTQKPVHEIAAEVGYKDAKFFSQQFSKTVGVKPNEYRRLYY